VAAVKSAFQSQNRLTSESKNSKIRLYNYCNRFAECPAGFSYISSVNGCYKVVRSKRDWAYAGLECRSLHKDAHLLVINNTQEQSAVASWLKNADGQLNTSARFYYIIVFIYYFIFTMAVWLSP